MSLKLPEINFKKEAQDIIKQLRKKHDIGMPGIVATSRLLTDEEAVEYINDKIIDILQNDERYQKLLEANGKILRIIDKLKTSSKLFEEYEEKLKESEKL